MARYIRSLHHGGARGMQHREHRSKKNRHIRVIADKRHPLRVEWAEKQIEREEKFWDMVMWKRKFRKK